MLLIESGDAEVIVFGEMSKIFFHHYQWGVFFMKSILNKSYHHSRALWSSFVTCGCGCVFNFLSIKSKYTPLFFSPTVKSKQEESTWADRWGIFIYICLPFSFFFFYCWCWWCDSTGSGVPACLRAFHQTHPRVCKQRKKRKSGRGKKEILPASLSCSELDGIDKQTPNKRNTTQTLLHH